jgi:hypothetical protein
VKKSIGLLLAVALVLPGFCARPSGSSSSSSSRSSYSSPSRSYSSPSSSKPSSSGWGSFSSSKPSTPAPTASRPSTPTPQQAAPAKSSGWGFFSKPSTPAAQPTQAVKPSAPAMARQATAVQTTQQSKAAYQAYKQPPPVQKYASNPVYNKVIVSTNRPTYQVYQNRRNVYYQSYRPPVYVHYGYPQYRSSYGMYDAMFMWMMLDRMNDDNYRRMYYHHQNDPAFQEWRTEANRLSADNAELRAKLAQMDAQTAQLQGQPQDPNYVPQGVDPAVMLSDDTAKQTFAQAEVQQPVPAPEPKGEGIGCLGWGLIIGGIALVLLLLIRFFNRKTDRRGPYDI